MAATYGGEWVRVTATLQGRRSDLAERSERLSPQARGLVRGFSVVDSKLDQAPSLRHLPSLDWLQLSRNGIREIDNLKGLRLRYLELAGNRITDISPLADCPVLTTLLLDRNPIRDIAGLNACTELIVLHLSGTEVSSLPEMSGLRRMRELDMVATPLTSLDGIETIPSDFDLNVMYCEGLRDIDALLTARVRTLYMDESAYKRLQPWFDEHLDDIRAKRPEFKVEFRYIAGE